MTIAWIQQPALFEILLVQSQFDVGAISAYLDTAGNAAVLEKLVDFACRGISPGRDKPLLLVEPYDGPLVLGRFRVSYGFGGRAQATDASASASHQWLRRLAHFKAHHSTGRPDTHTKHTHQTHTTTRPAYFNHAKGL
jgi:hypothetical protein